MKTATPKKPQNALVDVADVVVDPRLQMREKGLDEAHVQDVLAAIKAKQSLPRIELFRVDGKLYVVDGFHTLEAHRLAGRDRVAAIVRDGSWTDAVTAAATSNNTKLHKALKRSPEDKRRAARMLLEAHPEWADRRIAAELGISHDTVASERSKLASTGENRQLDARTGVDGKTRRVAPKAEPKPLPEPPPPPADAWRKTPLTQFLRVHSRIQDAIDELGLETAGQLADLLADAPGELGLIESDLRDLAHVLASLKDGSLKPVEFTEEDDVEEREEEKPAARPQPSRPAPAAPKPAPAAARPTPPGPVPTEKPARKADVSFDWRGAEARFGAVVRDVEAVAAAHDSKTFDYAQCRHLLNEFDGVWKGWKRKLTGGK